VSEPGLQVAIWSDYICPFCRAAEPTAAWLEDRFGAAVTWLPFDLHPEYPPTGLPREQLVARYGPAGIEHVRRFFAARGLRYNPHPTIVPNSRTALRLAELARAHGRHDALHAALMDGYWEDGRDIGDADVLRELATAAALPAEEVETVLGSDRFLDVVEGSTRQAARIGASGVPAFLLEGRLLVAGAQPEEVFEKAIRRLRRA
jgi:predicted DsbA family dithiol-disulfide isomerase